MNTTFYGLAVFSFPLAILLIIERKWFLHLFGSEFVQAEIVLIILALAQLINSLVGPVGYLLTMTGYQKQAAWALGAGVLLNLLLNILFIPLYGINGAAMATAISLVSWRLYSVFLSRKLLGVNMFPVLLFRPTGPVQQARK
jgi:O-antigen/teichoic acid export membrane protein